MEPTLGTEEKILAAATEVFCQRGFDGARMQEIADAAEISKASLHYYFRSKEGLFKRSVQVLFTQIIGSVVSNISAECSIEEMIAELVKSYYEAFTLHRRQALFFFSEMIKYENLLDDVLTGIPHHKIMKNLLLRFDQERQKGTIVDISPHDLLVDIISMCMYPIIASPMLKRMFAMNDAEMKAFLEQRRKHVTGFVLAAIIKEKQ